MPIHAGVGFRNGSKNEASQLYHLVKSIYPNSPCSGPRENGKPIGGARRLGGQPWLSFSEACGHARVAATVLYPLSKLSNLCGHCKHVGHHSPCLPSFAASFVDC